MSEGKKEHCCSACGIDYSVYTALLVAGKRYIAYRKGEDDNIDAIAYEMEAAIVFAEEKQ